MLPSVLLPVSEKFLWVGLCVDFTCDAALSHSVSLLKFVGFSADHVAGVNVVLSDWLRWPMAEAADSLVELMLAANILKMGILVCLLLSLRRRTYEDCSQLLLQALEQ